ncbi:GerAB/ArcD/ProY family transporter [Vallitalea maricola]|uniref:Uncharacterized protein n=1 Tax=Vallitalea maricola TaxID=3074433 RepID=A0ACB5UMY1_9FIRM|nr:hypothetical protein AN2V17_31290 [Vallitalea sp. AN17-2]
MKETLTNKQIAFILFGATLGFAVISLPRSIAEKGGTSGWIFIVIGTMTMIVFGYVVVYFGHTFPNKTITEYMPILTGKFISNVIIIMIIIYEITSLSFITRLTSETMKLTMLLETPIWALSLILLIVAFYTLTKSLITLGRIAEIFGVIIIIWGLAITLTIFTQGRLINVKPIFEFSDMDLIGGLSVISFSIIGIETLTVIPINKKNKKLFRYIVSILLIISLLYILMCESCISVMGVEGVVHYKETVYATIRRIELPELQFLKRLDGGFIIVWLMGIYCSILYEAYVTTYLISKLVKVKKNKILLITLFLSLIICLTPPTRQITENLLEYVGYLGVFINIVIPSYLLILLLISKYGKNSEKRSLNNETEQNNY